MSKKLCAASSEESDADEAGAVRYGIIDVLRTE